MIDFINWCQENELTLPTTDENTTRNCAKPQYPPAYGRAQYPDLYFTPTSASAPVDLKNSKNQKVAKGSDTAAN